MTLMVFNNTLFSGNFYSRLRNWCYELLSSLTSFCWSDLAGTGRTSSAQLHRGATYVGT